MERISIHPVADADDQFCAVSGSRQSFGKTMGEALDGLAGAIGQANSSAVIFIQKLGGDEFFSDEQHARMVDLKNRLASLSEAEYSELEELIGAELDATVARTEALFGKLAA